MPLQEQASIRDMSDMSPEELAEVQKQTNATLREIIIETLARLDAGDNIEAFTFAVAVRRDGGGDPEALITMGGESRPALGLIDVQQFGMIKNAVRGGVLIPNMPERLLAIKGSGYVNPVDILGVVLDAGRIIEGMEADSAAEAAANEAGAIIKRASGQN